MEPYRLETDAEGKKFVRVGDFIIYRYDDRIEVIVDDGIVETIPYMLIEPTKAEKLHILKDAIYKYHAIASEPCPFDI
jgi:hypothetical protein